MPNVINQMMMRELSESFRGTNGMLIVSMNGLTVAETEAFRSDLAEHGVRLQMVRNRLANLALKESGVEAPEGFFAGNIGICCGEPEDAINAAKAVSKSPAKKAGKLAFHGGLLDGDFLGAEEASALAGLPGKDELRGKILGCLVGPQQKLVGLLNAPQGALARVLQAKVDAGGGAGEEA